MTNCDPFLRNDFCSQGWRTKTGKTFHNYDDASPPLGGDLPGYFECHLIHLSLYWSLDWSIAHAPKCAAPLFPARSEMYPASAHLGVAF
jgi:hypothetical protein